MRKRNCLSTASVTSPRTATCFQAGIHEIPIDIYQESGKIQANSAFYGVEGQSRDSLPLARPQDGKTAA
jgi:hypothetical protein